MAGSVGYKVGDLSKLLHAGVTTPVSESTVKLSKEDKKLASLFGQAVLSAQTQISAQNKKDSKRKKKETNSKDADIPLKKDRKLKKIVSSSCEVVIKDKVSSNAEPTVNSVGKGEKGEEETKIKKKKADNKKASLKKQNDEGYNPPAGIVHESLLKTTQNTDDKKTDKKKQKRKRKLSESDDEVEAEDNKSSASNASKESKKVKRLRRDRLHKETNPKTVFIGNLPLTVKKRKLTKMFKKFGAIESIRYRCLPPKNPKLPKKVIAIKKEFHPERHNCVAFIKFETEEAAKSATSLNGELVDGFHIRVDTADKRKAVDTKHTVFVGNIPFDIEEDPIRGHFQDCGTVENVRIIRDANYGIGKGFCYVRFAESDAVPLALKLNGSEFKERKLRVSMCEADVKKKKKNKSKQTTADKLDTAGKKRHRPLKPSNRKKKVFQGETSIPDFKRKKKDMKKMRTKFKEKQKKKRSLKQP